MSLLTEFEGLLTGKQGDEKVSLAIAPCRSKGALAIALSQILQLF